MNPVTLATLLNTAQLIIQSADKLGAVLRQRNLHDEPVTSDKPASLDELRFELERLHQRLEQSDNTNVEQLEMIEQLARQNETLATSLKTAIRRASWALVLASGALSITLLLLIWLVVRG